MPIISAFFGIVIRMFFYDNKQHHVPHIHAEYQNDVAIYSIQDGSLISGNLPPAKNKLVVAWIEIHREDLVAAWNLAVTGQKIFPIKGLE